MFFYGTQPPQTHDERSICPDETGTLCATNRHVGENWAPDQVGGTIFINSLGFRRGR